MLHQRLLFSCRSFLLAAGLIINLVGDEAVAQEWIHLSSNAPAPADRLSSAWIYDSVRGRHVLFGGANGPSTQYADTWEWDQANQLWQLVSSSGPSTPSPRSVMAYGFDPVRAKSVAWGGAVFNPGSLGVFFNETWEWDGVAWLQGPTAPFAGRCGACMAYDTSRSRMMLFGGQGQSTFDNDLWSYDGVAWVQVHPGGGTAPPARFFHGMTYDESRDGLVVFGGTDGASQFGDTWEWDGTSWSSVTGAAPPARSEHAMAYHPEAAATVLYGGTGVGGLLGDVWLLKAGRWIEVDALNAPVARRHPAMQYDVLEDAMVLFGGQGAAPLNELWKFDLPTIFDIGADVVAPAGPQPEVARHAIAPLPGGGALLFGGENAAGPFFPTLELVGGIWEKKSSLVNPLTRTRSVLVLDEARNQNLMFGGLSPVGGYLGDTWTYQLGQWSLVQPQNSPGPRAGHAAAYDPTSGGCWLFGGENAAGLPLDDLWFWDGVDWSQVATTTVPPARVGHGMAWDSRREYLVMYGGRDANGRLNDTWVFDGVDWSQVSLRPGDRVASNLIWDSTHARLLEFGGGRNGSVADFWAVKPASAQVADLQWQPIITSPAPSPRNGAAASFDPVRGEAVVFGGYSLGDAIGGTWLFDGAFWREAVTAVSPPPLASADMVFDASRNVSVLFGGFEANNGGVRSDTWEWDGSGWTLRSPATVPAARSSHAMAYDSLRQRVVMFGGRVAGGAFVAETWEYDGVDWALKSISGPAPRIRAEMAYDPIRNEVVLFGGRSAAGSLRETWVWDGNTWSQRFPADSPPGAVDAAMAFDVARGVVSCFGGRDDSTAEPNNELWDWDGANWTQPSLYKAAQDVNPGAIDEFAMTFDEKSERVVVIGGRDANGCVDGIWAWGGARWQSFSAGAASAFPGAREGAAAYVDRVDESLRFLGGECAGVYSDELWELRLPVPARYNVYGQGCPGSNGQPVLRLDPSTPAIVGQSVSLTYSNAASLFLPVFIALGSDDEFFQAGIPLPLDLTVAGLPGCSLLNSAERIELAGLANAQLEVDYSFAVPNLAVLVGQDFFFQGLHLEPLTSPNFAALTQGVYVRIGDR